MNNQPFHLVDISPWPLFASLNVYFLTMGLSKWFTLGMLDIFILGIVSLFLSCIQWWRDIIRESTSMGEHYYLVIMGLRWGMILFIISEILFFFSFFWAFFHSSLSPSIDLGCYWPPYNVISFNPEEVPLINTMLLLSSGASVTWSHHSLLENMYKEYIKGLILTIFLGVMFTMVQLMEYWESNFSLSDSIYGSTFFVATGFHGLHVIIGTIFLLIMLFRSIKMHFSSLHHVGLEAASWYWHFVDVVWLFLFVSIYWWGKN
uniref:Cytochrome c oxidase subunit 3 n=1 Tax=Arisubathynella cheongmiensis TaxID=2025387 RepID=A0A7R6D912_9CRUS|nr:cytochrome oxidase subunit 3 [Arisubathynella cheongmiensis]